MFTRKRKIKNNFYWYAETRWREGGKVKSKSTFLGRVFSPPSPEEKSYRAADRAMDKWEKEKAAREDGSKPISSAEEQPHSTCRGATEEEV